MQAETTPNVRYVDNAAGRSPLRVQPPLRLLAVISSPQGGTQRNAATEKQQLEAVLAPLVREGKLLVDWLEPATLQELHRRLRGAEFHVIHFVGRAELDQRNGEAALVLEDGSGGPRPISAASLGVLLQDHPSLRLAVLQPGGDVRGSGDAPFGGIALTLVSHGVAAVLDAPVEVTDSASASFLGAFYAAILAGRPATAAATESATRLQSVAPGRPLVYLGARDGVIFRFPGPGLGKTLASKIPRLRLEVPAWALLGAGAGVIAGIAIVAAVVVFTGGDDNDHASGGGGGVPPTEVPTEPPVVSAPEERIYFSSVTVESERETEQLFSMAPDGSSRQPLTSGVPDGIQPDVSADCSQIVFISRDGDVYDILILDVEAGGVTTLPAEPGRKEEPAFSPDGTQVVFARETAPNISTLFVMNVDGSGLRALTGGEFDEQDAAWSPDGAWIAFASDRDAPRRNHEIYRIPADGSSAPVRLTTQPGFDGEPAWSPDGSRIAFQSVREEDDLNDFSIWVMDADAGDQGPGLTRLTDEPGREFDPVWSPDGSMVAYTYLDGDAFDIFVVAADGGTPSPLTRPGSQDRRPTWCRTPGE